MFHRFRMRIEHWELNIGQILPSPLSAKLFLRGPLAIPNYSATPLPRGKWRLFEMLGCAVYRPETGVSPAFRIVVAASGDARKRIRALAASGCRAVLVSAPAKETSG